MEIERKFLVVSEDYKHEAVSSSQIIQGFLNTDPERTVRIRIRDKEANLTIKGKSNEAGTIRNEWEIAIGYEMARELLAISEGPVIEKIRYLVPKGDHTFEVDKFCGDNEGLVIAELELDEEDEEYYSPQWLGREVTGEIKYYNSQLSKTPYKEWQD